jgi:plastocyanin domain-containing protein
MSTKQSPVKSPDGHAAKAVPLTQSTAVRIADKTIAFFMFPVS